MDWIDELAEKYHLINLGEGVLSTEEEAKKALREAYNRGLERAGQIVDEMVGTNSDWEGNQGNGMALAIRKEKVE